MIAFAAAWLGKSVLMQSPIGDVLKAVPRRVWLGLVLGLAIGLAALFAWRWHAGKIEQLRSSADAAGYARAIAEGKQRVVIVERGSETISSEERNKGNEEIERNGRRADALRVRGPGAAACVNPALPVGAGGHEPVGGRADDPMAGMPGDERERFIALPFGETVDRAEQADANRTEVLAWRAWHVRLTAWWEKVRAQAGAANEEEKK